MKISDLRDKIERFRGYCVENERLLMSYRDKHPETGVTIAECEARAQVNCSNVFLGFLDRLVYDQEVELT